MTDDVLEALGWMAWQGTAHCSKDKQRVLAVARAVVIPLEVEISRQRREIELLREVVNSMERCASSLTPMERCASSLTLRERQKISKAVAALAAFDAEQRP